MSVQGVNITVQDGGLNQSPPGLGNTLVVIGTSSTGTANIPLQSQASGAFVAAYGYGPGPELAEFIVAQTGNPVIFIKAATATGGTNAAVRATTPGGSTSVVTITGTPNDTYYGRVTVITGGTIGTNGIQIAVSIDDGRTVLVTVNLLTATTYAIPNTGLTVNFSGSGTATLVAGDYFQWVSTEPLWSDANVSAALNGLLATTDTFLDIIVTGGATSTAGGPGSASGDVTAFDGYMTTLFNKRRFSRLLCNARDAVWGGASTENEATWISSLQTDFAASSSLRVGASAGHYNIISAVTQSQMRRPLLWTAAGRDSAVAIQVDLGRVSDGTLKSLVMPTKPDGYIYHDESQNPGLDAARLLTMWTLYGIPGVFIKNPNLLAPPGSDFNWLQHGHVMDVASTVSYLFFAKELSDSVRVFPPGTPNAGQILPQDAQDLTGRCKAQLDDALTNANAISGCTVTIPPGQNILSTAALNVTISITPLGYLKSINITLTFINPAIQQVGG